MREAGLGAGEGPGQQVAAGADERRDLPVVGERDPDRPPRPRSGARSRRACGRPPTACPARPIMSDVTTKRATSMAMPRSLAGPEAARGGGREERHRRPAEVEGEAGVDERAGAGGGARRRAPPPTPRRRAANTTSLHCAFSCSQGNAHERPPRQEGERREVEDAGEAVEQAASGTFVHGVDHRLVALLHDPALDLQGRRELARLLRELARERARSS